MMKRPRAFFLVSFTKRNRKHFPMNLFHSYFFPYATVVVSTFCAIQSSLFSISIESYDTLQYADSIPQKTPFYHKGRSQPLQEVIRLFQASKNSKAFTLLSSLASQGKVTLSEIEKECSPLSIPALHKAIASTKEILSLKQKTGLSFKILFPISIFIETQFQELISKEIFYIPEKKLGREIQYDPQTGKIFIHLGTHGVKPIGVGMKKVVTPTLLYSDTAPEVMARGVAECDITQEIEALEALHGSANVMEAIAVLTHKARSKKYMTIISEIANQGSLYHVLHTNSLKLSLRDKITLARDLSLGLSEMHLRGYVHRDLGPKNHLVHAHKIGKDIHYVGTVSDFGRTIRVSEAIDVPVQGNKYYISPEGYFRQKMKRDDYKKSDTYALGAVIWEIYFGKVIPWGKIRYITNEKDSLSKRYKNLVAHQKKCMKPIERFIKANKRKRGIFRAKALYLETALKMIAIDPKKRITSQEAFEQFQILLNDPIFSW